MPAQPYIHLHTQIRNKDLYETTILLFIARICIEFKVGKFLHLQR